MSVFSFLGIFALWGFLGWLIVLLGLLIADAIWTHGLATSYLHATGLIISQIWSFLQVFITIIQRVIAMAPRALQVTLFFVMGAFFFGILANWFLAANIVCANGIPYQGSSIASVWMAKSLDVRGEQNFSAAIENAAATSGSGAFTAGGGTGGGGGGGGAGGSEEMNNSAGVEVSVNGTASVYNVNASGYNVGFATLFSGGGSTREDFVRRSIEMDKSSFVPVTNDDSSSVVYSCSQPDGKDVEIGLFGIKNLLSMETMLVIMTVGMVFWLLKFFGVF